MFDALTVPLIRALPPFMLPDQHGAAVTTAHLRGRRNLVLMLLPRLDADAVAYLAAFAARREEWAWLHTAVLAVTVKTADVQAVTAAGLPVLQDSGAVRSALLPGTEASMAALIVADTEGRVTEWHTAPCVNGLPDVEAALAWAWEAARPRGACDGGVAWARPAASVAPPPLPAPIGHFTIGAKRSSGGTPRNNGRRDRGTGQARRSRYQRDD